MMLNHVGLQEKAELIKNAWACTIEQGIHTEDIYKENTSKQLVSTRGFAEAVISNLGKKPQQLEAVEYEKNTQITIPSYKRKMESTKTLRGVDVFVDWKGDDPNQLAERLLRLNNDLQLKMITNRGVKVWPEGFDETFCTDHWRCRYEADDQLQPSRTTIVDILNKAIDADIDVIKTENLYAFDGKRGYSLGQGQ